MDRVRPCVKVSMVFFGPNMTYFNGSFSGIIGSFDELAPGGLPGLPTGPSANANSANTPSSSISGQAESKRTTEVVIKPSVTLFKDAQGMRIGKMHVLATFGVHMGSDAQHFDISGQLDVTYPCDAGQGLTLVSFSA